MRAKYIFTIIIALLVVIIGQSFFGQFKIAKAVLNLPSIALVIFCFFGKDDLNNLIAAVFLAFFLELTSPYYGFYLGVFLILWLILKYVIRAISEKNVLSFVFIALGSGVIYQSLFLLFSIFFKSIPGYFNWQSLIYNFIASIVMYYIYGFFKKQIQG